MERPDVLSLFKDNRSESDIAPEVRRCFKLQKKDATGDCKRGVKQIV